MVNHIVLFKLESEGLIEETVEVLRAMEGAVPSLQAIEVGVDEARSPRSYDIALTTRFATWEDLEAYRVHPHHAKVLAHMADVAETAAVVDYES